MVWHALLLGKHTVTVVKASFTVEKLCGAGPASTMMGCTLLSGGPSGFTVTVAIPALLASCVEVAVIVTCSDTSPPEGAMNKPEAEIVPALADHVTPELKFPVPITVAEH